MTTTIIKSEKDFGGYWIKGMKTFKGHEGEPCFQASVYKDGKKIGFFSQDSWGGSDRLDCTTPELEKELCDYAKSVDPKPWAESYSTFISQIADAFESNKFYKRHCKTKTVFRLKEDGLDDYRTLKIAYGERAQKYLDDKYGDQVAIIVNKELGQTV